MRGPHLDVEERLTALPARLEEMTFEVRNACEDEANTLADYEEAYYRLVVTSDAKSAVAREQEAKASVMPQRRRYLLAAARVKALRSEQNAIESSLSAFQSLMRGVVRQGG